MIKLPVEIWDYIFDLVGERPRVESCIKIMSGVKIICLQPKGRFKHEYEEIIRMLTK